MKRSLFFLLLLLPLIVWADEDVTIRVRRIWQGDYCAFTSLIYHNGFFYCSFREADTHHANSEVPGTLGRSRILRSKNGKSWQSVALLRKDGIDLRDPCLSLPMAFISPTRSRSCSILPSPEVMNGFGVSRGIREWGMESFMAVAYPLSLPPMAYIIASSRVSTYRAIQERPRWHSFPTAQCCLSHVAKGTISMDYGGVAYHRTPIGSGLI